MKYKGIELEGLDKKVKLSHSRVMETDEGTDWIDKLLTCDKAALTPTQFHEVSALSSVIDMDYQICNGGISQYVFNGYHEDCPPCSDDDVAHLGQSGQVAMLRELASFGDEAFPASRDENGAIRRWAGEFRFLDWFSLFKVDGCELVTVLVARPGQVARYYEPFGEDVPDWLMARAYENTCVRHLNY